MEVQRSLAPSANWLQGEIFYIALPKFASNYRYAFIYASSELLAVLMDLVPAKFIRGLAQGEWFSVVNCVLSPFLDGTVVDNSTLIKVQNLCLFR